MCGGELRLKNKTDFLLGCFIAFFLFNSIAYIGLNIANNPFKNVNNTILIFLNVAQILSILFMFMKKSIGATSFFITRILFAVFNFISNMSIVNLVYNILILLCFYIFYENSNKELGQTH